MEEFIHRVMLLKSTPDWFPLRPGSSFWVPPLNIDHSRATDFVQKLADALTEGDSLISQGCSSSAYFLYSTPNFIFSPDLFKTMRNHFPSVLS